jgi:hypothetical protein
MNDKDSQLLAEAYALVLEAKKKKKLSPEKKKKLAAAAPPYDKITRADIITLAKKKKLKESTETEEDEEEDEEEHCDAAKNGCDCDGCEECQARQKEVEKESVDQDPDHQRELDWERKNVSHFAPRQFKVGDYVVLQHPNYPGMKNKKFNVQQVRGDMVDLIGIDANGYAEPRNGVFWVETKYISPTSK